jgi:hypothetical protein
MDEDFLHGSTGRSATYDNPPLAQTRTFVCVEFEVWGLELALR